MKTAYVSQASVEVLAEEFGAACGELRAGFDGLAEMHAMMGERIANLEKRVNELSAPRPKRSRAPRRRLQVLDAIAAE